MEVDLARTNERVFERSGETVIGFILNRAPRGPTELGGEASSEVHL
jgi:hypothetical protein